MLTIEITPVQGGYKARLLDGSKIEAAEAWGSTPRMIASAVAHVLKCYLELPTVLNKK